MNALLSRPISAVIVLVLAGGMALNAGVVTSMTTSHATIDSTAASANGNTAGFATRWNALGLDASFLVLDFNLSASEFGGPSIADLLSVSLLVTHDGGDYTIGRFNVFYVENSGPSIADGSNGLVYDGVYSLGFDANNPPTELSGLTKVADRVVYDPTGPQTIPLDLSIIEPSLIAKIEISSMVRLVVSEGGDNTVASWHGLGNSSPLPPSLVVDAIAVPEPSSLILLITFLAFTGTVFRRPLNKRG